MDQQTLGKISLALIKHRVRSGGLRLGDLKEDIETIHKATGLSRRELREFFETIYREAVNEAFRPDPDQSM